MAQSGAYLWAVKIIIDVFLVVKYKASIEQSSLLDIPSAKSPATVTSVNLNKTDQSLTLGESSSSKKLRKEGQRSENIPTQ